MIYVYAYMKTSANILCFTKSAFKKSSD